MAASLIAIAGPTGVGKSEVALLLATALQGEIISVDSMQVYRGMDIGTAKPSREERQRVPHHLIDILEISQSFDAAQFVSAAGIAIKQIRSRGKVPILCGGTGLYFKALFEGLGDAPPANTDERARLEAMPEKERLAELKQADPTTYERIDKNNARRVIRALEVIRLTGKPFSEQRAAWSNPDKRAAPSVFIVLTRPAESLQKRIDQRVEQMFRNGLVQETQRLLEHGLQKNRTAMQALGYRQVCDHLERGVSLKETIELVKVRTRQFAKRQMTWFRRQSGDAHWIEIPEGESAETTAGRIEALISQDG